MREKLKETELMLARKKIKLQQDKINRLEKNARELLYYILDNTTEFEGRKELICKIKEII